MSWTINSKTLKTSPSTTDSIPIQEAGGTTKRTAPGNTSGGIPLSNGVQCANLFASKAQQTNLITIPSGDFKAIVSAAGNLYAGITSWQFASACTNLPTAEYWFVEIDSVSVSSPVYLRAFARSMIDKRCFTIVCSNGTWDSGGSYNGWTPRLDGNGNPVFPVVATTASAANAYIAGSGNTILQSTSSAKYKTDIVTLDDSSTLDRLRPVLYKSNPETVPGDDPTKEHYGFIAEELHEIDEKLVQYVDDVPNGVQYDRITVLLVKRIHELEARLAKAGI